MAEGFTVSKFKDVSEGLQPGQFNVGDRKKATSFDDLDPIYKKLMDDPVVMILSVIGPDGRPGLTPMWFDYEGDKVLINTASHRPKCKWIRDNPQVSLILVNPENPYHWMSMKATVVNEVPEDGPDGQRVTDQLNRLWKKYMGNDDGYQLRDPSIDEKRVLFECRVDKLATFGKPS